MGLNLTGTWKYREDFSYGDSEGVLELSHKGQVLTGILKHKEILLDGDSYTIHQELEGKVNVEEMSFSLLANSFSILDSLEELSDELDYFEAQLINENLIVGTTKDKQNVTGVFSFKRIL